MLLPKYDELVGLKNAANPAEFHSKAKMTTSTQGGHASLFKGRGLDFSEVREYASGDDIRSIDWRVTARMARTHTKVFTEERERSVYVIVDMNNYMEFGTRQTFKSVQAAKAAALIVWRAHTLHDKVGAVLFGHIPERVRILPAKRSRKPIWDMFKMLCAPSSSAQEVKIEDALIAANRRIPRGSTVFVISDFFELNQNCEKHLGQLAKRCEVTLVKVSDPADKEIPQVDEIQFSNGENNKVTVNTNDIEGATRYRELWLQKESAIEKIAFRFRTKLIEISTARDVKSDLISGVVAYEGRKSS